MGYSPAKNEAKKRWRAKHPDANSHKHDPVKQKTRRDHIKAAINPCYLKEARAMLQGKDTRGKNRCVKLTGDD